MTMDDNANIIAVPEDGVPPEKWLRIGPAMARQMLAELAALEKFRADVLAIGDMNAADFAKWQYVKMLIDEQKGR
jgi:hypothetical protein